MGARSPSSPFWRHAPSSKPRPSKSTSDAVNQWIDEKALGVVCAGTPKPGRVTLRRLNREEYGNAMRDLLGIGYRVGEDLPADDVGDGFDNQADVLTLSPLHLEKYLANAEQAVSQAWRSLREARLRHSQQRPRDHRTVKSVYCPADPPRLEAASIGCRSGPAHHDGPECRLETRRTRDSSPDGHSCFATLSFWWRENHLPVLQIAH